MDCPVVADSSTTNSSLIQGEPNDDDVLLGRGNHVNYHPGNIRFRQLAVAKSPAYAAAKAKGDKRAKDVITTQLVDEVTENGARFLREVEAVDEPKDCVWEVVTGQVVSTKVRQAMRDALKASRDSTAALLGKRESRHSLAAAGKCSRHEQVHISSPCAVQQLARKKDRHCGVNRASQEVDMRPAREAQQLSHLGLAERSMMLPDGIHHQHLDSQNNHCLPPSGGISLGNDSPMPQHSSTISDAGAGYRRQFLQGQQRQHQFTGNLSANGNMGIGSFAQPQNQDTQRRLHRLILHNSMIQQRTLPVVNGLFPTGFGQHTIPRDHIWLSSTHHQQHSVRFLDPSSTTQPPPPPLAPREIVRVPFLDTAVPPSHHNHQHVNFGASGSLAHDDNDDDDDNSNHTAATAVSWTFSPPLQHRVTLPDHDRQHQNEDSSSWRDFQPPLDHPVQPLASSYYTTSEDTATTTTAPPPEYTSSMTTTAAARSQENSMLLPLLDLDFECT